jgi:hypothetical protein
LQLAVGIGWKGRRRPSNHSPLFPSAGWARKCGTATEGSTTSPPVSSYSTTPPRVIGEPRPDPDVLNLVDAARRTYRKVLDPETEQPVEQHLVMENYAH